MRLEVYALHNSSSYLEKVAPKWRDHARRWKSLLATNLYGDFSLYKWQKHPFFVSISHNQLAMPPNICLFLSSYFLAFAARGSCCLLRTRAAALRRGGRWRPEQSPGRPALPADLEPGRGARRAAPQLPWGGHWMWAHEGNHFYLFFFCRLMTNRVTTWDNNDSWGSQ